MQVRLFEMGRAMLNAGVIIQWKEVGEERLGFCLLAFTLAGRFFYSDADSAAFLMLEARFLSSPRTEDQWFSRNPPDLQEYTGSTKTVSHRRSSSQDFSSMRHPQ